MIKTRPLALLLATLILIGLMLPGTLPVTADGEEVPLEERAMREAITMLGWPNTITTQRMYDLAEDDDTMFLFWPPGDALQFVASTKTSATNGGSYDEETIQYARILSLGDKGGKLYLDKMVENGFSRSSYQGRPAAVVQTGQKMCNAGGLVGYLAEYVRKLFSGIFGDAVGDSCPYASAGYITWTCGAHAFVARDDTGQGGEEAIAAALFAAAEHQGLCDDIGDTLVILAQTNDVTGTKPITQYVEMGQQVNSYYGQNAYGNVALSYTYLDADGDGGTEDWFTVDANMADYQNKETQFAVAAVQKAFEAGIPQEQLELSRVIVVYAGSSQQATHNAASPAPLSTVCAWKPEYTWHEIEVGPADNQSEVIVSSLILVAENDGLGLWTHEIGHSLYGRFKIYGLYDRIGDRYNYQEPYGQNGDISNWGLMGSGNWWGDPLASSPVHMSAFSKESAGWLKYTDVKLDEWYTLTPLENQANHNALKIDNPTGANPQAYILVEARQGGGAYGAPESGVVAYVVTWDGANKHHVVNNLNPTSGPTTATGVGNRTYDRPTLHDAEAAGGVSELKITPWRLKLTLHSEDTSNGYSAVVSTSVYTPANLVGAVVAPAAAPAAAPPTVTANVDGPLPDIDLHAWDGQGRHVGLDYASGQYVNEIPGAEASGDLRNDDEWIYVPEGTQVRFAVSAEKTRQFLEANPAWAAVAQPQRFEITYGRFDSEGKYTIADGGEGVVPAGIEAPLSAPTDPSLRYKPAPALHYGRNWPEDLPLMAFFAGVVLLGAVGWVTALVRR